MPPALVGALWRMGKVTNDDIAATLLDLAVKGVLRIEPSRPRTAADRRSRSSSTAASWTGSTS